MSRSRSPRRPSPSPANSVTPRSSASFRSAGVPAASRCSRETWNPPITTGMPAARNWRARSSARGILVRLHADQPDKARARGADLPDRALDVDDRCCTRHRRRSSMSTSAPSTFCVGAFRQQSVDARETVRRDGGAPPLDDVAVRVVMRRLDQDDLESFPRHVRAEARADVANPSILDRENHTNATHAEDGTASVAARADCHQIITLPSSASHIRAASTTIKPTKKNPTGGLDGYGGDPMPRHGAHHSDGH